MNRLPLLCIFGLFLAFPFGDTAAGSVPSFSHKWGAAGTGPGQFDGPRGVAVDPSGNVYVADTGNHRVQKFAPTGTFLREWGGLGTGNGQFDSPWDLAVDDSCHVYVVDTFNSRVQKFTCDGVYVTQWGSVGNGDGNFGQPRGIAVDDSFHVYVSDESLTRQRVQKFDSMGGYILQWGTPGSGNGQFNSPREIAVDANFFVYVLDTAPNQRVQKFTSMGTYVSHWGGVLFPRGIGVGWPDTVYVTDETHRVLKFNSVGTLLDFWGSFCDVSGGTGCDGQFNQPQGVVTHQNWVYVVDKGNSRIQAFLYPDPIGVPEDQLGAGAGPLRVFPNPSSSRVQLALPLVSSQGRAEADYAVQVRIFNLSGRLVQELFSGTLPAGEHKFHWDGGTYDGGQAGPGIYYVQAIVNGKPVRSTKVVRLR